MERERVTATLTRLGVPVPEGADPLEVMARALAVAAGDLETMRLAVANVDPTDATDPTIRLYSEALDRAGRLSKVAADTNLAERMAGISEQNIRTVVDAVRRAVDSAALDHPDRQRVLNAVAHELRGVAHT
jgi:hypothetical protein